MHNCTQLILLLTVVLWMSCTQKKPIEIRLFNPEETLDTVHLSSNEGISFHYVINDTNQCPMFNYQCSHITCTVKNNNSYGVYFLQTTCNALEPYVVDEYYKTGGAAILLLQCNTNGPKIGTLPAGDSIVFTTLIQTPLPNYNNCLGIDFRVVDRFLSVLTLVENRHLIKDVYGARTVASTIIWAENPTPCH